MENMEKGKFVIILARTGSGKTTLEESLKELFNLSGVTAWSMKTATTRKIREGESENAYLFLSNDEFDKMKKNGDFLSSFDAPNGSWVKYGVPTYINKKDGVGLFSAISQSYAMDTYNSLKEKGEDAVLVVLDVSLKERMKRLSSRGEDPDSIKKRVEIEKIEGDYNLEELPSSSIIIKDDIMPPEKIAENVFKELKK